MNRLNIGDACYVHGCIAEIVGSNVTNFNIMIKAVYNTYKPKSSASKQLHEAIKSSYTNTSDPDAAGLYHVKSKNQVAIYAVQKESCQPLITDMFDIGDRIETTLTGGGLIGTVQSFELHSNRAVCVSDRVGGYKDKRTRYAYKYNEIIKYIEPIALTFDIGSIFLVNGEPMHVIQTSTNCLGLMDENFVVKYANVPNSSTDRHILKHYKLDSIEQIDFSELDQEIIAICVGGNY